MKTGELVIRNAELDDVALLADLSARTFKSAYRDMLPADALDDFIAATFSPGSIREEMKNPTNKFLLAYAETRLVGYAMLRENDPPASVSGPDPVELARIYLDDLVIGRGFGSALMGACSEAARQAGYGTVWLGVWERNERAIRFYKKWDFEIVGSQGFEFGDVMHTDLVMMRSNIDRSTRLGKG